MTYILEALSGCTFKEQLIIGVVGFAGFLSVLIIGGALLDLINRRH